jgi:hypothetical protein
MLLKLLIYIPRNWWLKYIQSVVLFLWRKYWEQSTGGNMANRTRGSKQRTGGITERGTQSECWLENYAAIQKTKVAGKCKNRS